jgi:7-carboxy-7-deazaguanine synthase
MAYAVKEIFKTLQGEGVHTGRVAVFCRFAGCNLWSGREVDRATAQCRFCDTDFVGGVKYATATNLAAAIEAEWGPEFQSRMVVLTGGEPALQFDQALKEALDARHFYVAIETNGTVPLKAEPRWICLSPKAGTALVLQAVDEVKVVFPQDGFDPVRETAGIDTIHRSVQPMDGPDREANTQAAIAYCFVNPQWRLSLQTHKWTGIR